MRHEVGIGRTDAEDGQQLERCLILVVEVLVVTFQPVKWQFKVLYGCALREKILGLRQPDEFGVQDLFLVRMMQANFLEHIHQKEKIDIELLID